LIFCGSEADGFDLVFGFEWVEREEKLGYIIYTDLSRWFGCLGHNNATVMMALNLNEASG
jgi:hypothetical protein